MLIPKPTPRFAQAISANQLDTTLLGCLALTEQVRLRALLEEKGCDFQIAYLPWTTSTMQIAQILSSDDHAIIGDELELPKLQAGTALISLVQIDSQTQRKDVPWLSNPWGDVAITLLLNDPQNLRDTEALKLCAASTAVETLRSFCKEECRGAIFSNDTNDILWHQGERQFRKFGGMLFAGSAKPEILGMQFDGGKKLQDLNLAALGIGLNLTDFSSKIFEQTPELFKRPPVSLSEVCEQPPSRVEFLAEYLTQLQLALFHLRCSSASTVFQNWNVHVPDAAKEAIRITLKDQSFVVGVLGGYFQDVVDLLDASGEHHMLAWSDIASIDRA